MAKLDLTAVVDVDHFHIEGIAVFERGIVDASQTLVGNLRDVAKAFFSWE